MIKYFGNNKLKLNISKSSYLVISNKKEDVKGRIELDKNHLYYKKEITYLGIKINDHGNLRKDIINSLDEKRSNVTIKFTNFCGKNFLAPINVKLKVLRSCVVSTFLYSCESWSRCIPNHIEITHRNGIKTALNHGLLE